MIGFMILTGFSGLTGEVEGFFGQNLQNLQNFLDRRTGFAGDYRMGRCAFFGLFLCVLCVFCGYFADCLCYVLKSSC